MAAVSDGRSCPSSSASCSSTTSVKASRVSWAPSRAVMKNATTRTPAGGCSTNVDINADLPAHAGARHHTYGPRPGSVQYAASSRNSASRPTSSGGAIRSTCLRYADRTAARPGPTLTVPIQPAATPPRSACTPQDPGGHAGRPGLGLPAWRRDVIWGAGGGQPRDRPGW